MDEKKVTVVFKQRTDKQNSVRFDTKADGAAMRSVYVTNEAMEALGDPKMIRVTIEAVVV